MEPALWVSFPVGRYRPPERTRHHLIRCRNLNGRAPLRSVLKNQKNTEVLLGEVTGIDAAARKVLLCDGEVAYDTLVLATGSRHHYFGKPEWETLAPGLKTIEDATEIRRRVLWAFEAAERYPDAARVRGSCAPQPHHDEGVLDWQAPAVGDRQVLPIGTFPLQHLEFFQVSAVK